MENPKTVKQTQKDKKIGQRKSTNKNKQQKKNENEK